MDSNALQNILVENSAINAAANSNHKRIKKRSSKSAKKLLHDADFKSSKDSPVPKKLKMPRIKSAKSGEKKLKSKEKPSSARSNSDSPLLQHLDSILDEVIQQQPISRNGCSPTSQAIDRNVSAEGKNRRSKKESKKKMAKNVENVNDTGYDGQTNIAANSGDSLNVSKKCSKSKRKSRESVNSTEDTDANEETKENVTSTEYNANLCSENGNNQNNLREANNSKRNSRRKSKNASQTAKNSDNMNNSDNNNSQTDPSPNIPVTNTDDKNVIHRKKYKKSPKRSTKVVCKMINFAQDNSNLSQNLETNAPIKALNTKGKKAGVKRKGVSENSTTNLEKATEKENVKKKRRGACLLQPLEQNSAKVANAKPPAAVSSTQVAVKRNNMEMTGKAKNPTKKIQRLNSKMKSTKVLKSLKNIKQKTSLIRKKKQNLNRGRPAQINKRKIGINKNKIIKAKSSGERKITRKQVGKVSAKKKANWRKKIAKKNKANDRRSKSKAKKIKTRQYTVKKKISKK